MARLGDICKFQSGGTPSKGEPSYFNGNIPWITTVALNGSIIDESYAVDWITEKAIENSAAKVVPANSVMVGTRVGVGKVAINKVPMSTSQDIISLLDIDESRWSKEFICKFILGKATYLNSQARGATIKGIKIETLAGLQLPDIPLDQQCKIAVSIDAVNNLIALRKEQLAKLDQLVKSRFIERFGDPRINPKGYDIVPISSLFDVGSSKRVFESEWREVGVPFYRAREIVKLSRDGHVDNELFIEESMYEAYKEKYGVPKAGDMMVTGVGTLGVCYIVKETDRFYFKDGNTLWFKNKGLCDVRFIKDQYDTDFVKEQITANANISTVGTYTITNANNTLVLIPPLEEQEQYVEFCKQTDKSKLAIQQSLDKLELLKKSLMQEYFG